MRKAALISASAVLATAAAATGLALLLHEDGRSNPRSVVGVGSGFRDHNQKISESTEKPGGSAGKPGANAAINVGSSPGKTTSETAGGTPGTTGLRIVGGSQPTATTLNTPPTYPNLPAATAQSPYQSACTASVSNPRPVSGTQEIVYVTSTLPNAGTFVTVHYPNGDKTYTGETVTTGNAVVGFPVVGTSGQQVIISVIVGGRVGCTTGFVTA